MKANTMKLFSSFIFALMVAIPAFAQNCGDVIITEVANAGSKKALYAGGEYIELQVIKDNVSLAGWFICDLPSPNSTTKETQGSIAFTDTVGSVFTHKFAKGTIILVCLGAQNDKYGAHSFTETTKIDEKTKCVVVFPYDGSVSAVPKSGRVVMTAKDNVALVSQWDKKAAIDIVSWGRDISWQGCPVVNIPKENLENGYVIYLKKGTDVAQRTVAENWISTSTTSDATPGSENQ